MRVVALVETAADETRVAAVPEMVMKLNGGPFEVHVEAGAGGRAGIADEAYRSAGATIGTDRAVLLREADVLLSVQPPAPEDLAVMRRGSAVIGFLSPTMRTDVVSACADHGLTSFALELVPRTTRAQGMDALSSQALVTGYRGAVIAAERCPKFFPMAMTAAGTIPPARVLVLGTGVAGLQSIATARRLGAVVEAYDVRAAAAEEVRSLGATFLDLGLGGQEGAGGYARVQSEDFLARQREVLGEHVAAADVVITTAAVPGRRAPLLVTTEMVHGMRPGAVVVDLAADGGGNCELTVRGRDVVDNGVLVIGVANPPAGMPGQASAMLSRNQAALLLHLQHCGALGGDPSGGLPDLDDDIAAGCCVTRGGAVTNPAVRAAIEEEVSA